jgi:hypothetical protein
MLPKHAPLVIAEQFGAPGRVKPPVDDIMAVLGAGPADLCGHRRAGDRAGEAG